MKPTHKLNSGLIVAIEYNNGGYPVEIWDVEDLCAGTYSVPIIRLPSIPLVKLGDTVMNGDVQRFSTDLSPHKQFLSNWY